MTPRVRRLRLVLATALRFQAFMASSMLFLPLAGCVATIPYTTEPDRAHPGYLVHIEISNATEEEYRYLVAQMSSKPAPELAKGRVGLKWSKKENKLIIREVEPNSPAQDAGLKQGDQIVSIDKQVITERDVEQQIVSKIRGEPGTVVVLEVLRQGKSEPESIELTRQKDPVLQKRPVTAIALENHQLLDGKASLVFRVANLKIVPELIKRLEGLKVVYADSEQLSPMLSIRGAFTQFQFRRAPQAQSKAQYRIIVTFDPNTPVDIGGYTAQSNANGEVSFDGIKLDVSSASEGVIWILDGMGNQVQALRSQDGRWLVTVKGQSLGHTLEKVVEMEALR